MGIPAQSRPELVRADRAARPGYAVPAALFALVIVGVLSASAWVFTDSNRAAGVNQREAARALHVAESGLAHALGLVSTTLRDTTLTRFLRGYDGVKANADDGLLVGYDLPADQEIPAAGRAFGTLGTYRLLLTDDQAETDGDVYTDRNRRLLARCIGETPDGGRAVIEAVIGNASVPAIGVDGNVKISQSITVTGRCGSVHANGTLDVTSNITVEAGASTAGTQTGSGVVSNTYGESLPEEENAQPLDIPDLYYSDFCTADADFILKANGDVVDVAAGTTTPATSSVVHGWKLQGTNPTVWKTESNTPTSGVYCIEGNAQISNNIGTATSPHPLTLILKGSIEISGNPYITSAHPDGILILADGDVKLSGNSSSSDPNYEGLVYAGSQCKLEGKTRIDGQLVCKNRPNPVGSQDFFNTNDISAEATIHYGCGGILGDWWRVLAWYPDVDV